MEIWDGTITAEAPELRDARIREELTEEGVDLPELADTIEEADARAVASTYLFVLRNIKRDIDANDAEFTVLQDYNRKRHVERQGVLIRQTDYLRGVIEKLFGFMTTTGKKKSLNLIGGRIGERAQQDELVVENDGWVLEWARQHDIDGIARMKPTLDRKALRIWMEKMELNKDPDLSPPPGVKLEERPDVFYATPAE